ncbi:hypothetical protein EON82_02760 [bacterium]|nr:MAG: hypothetical protein EON82_02760 [bacterium]
MLPTLVALLPATFTPPQPWALGFAAPPRLPFAGDVDGDGLADLIVVYPEGETILDVNLTIEGVKSGGGIQALSKWAGHCDTAIVGEFDNAKGTDVVGLFGRNLKLAGGYRNGQFRQLADIVTLPKPLSKPALARIDGSLLAFSQSTGEAFRVDPRTKSSTSLRIPKGFIWIGDAGTFVAAKNSKGTVLRLDRETFRVVKKIGSAAKGSQPGIGPGWVAFGETVWTPDGAAPLPPSKLPVVDTIRATGDFDGDGDGDLVEFRYGPEAHTGNSILLRRFVSPSETDSDHDGLTNEEEKHLGTDPLNSDTDTDGLIDGWEVKGVRDLDLPKLGCDPRYADLVCLVSRFEGVNVERFSNEMARVKNFYADLPSKNPNGQVGLNFIKVDLPIIKGDDTKAAWWANRAKFRPERWRGIVHWMQVTPGGGGQADQLGDGGTCGEGALWAVFTHEFGHQLGLSHEGFWPNGSCPIYSSMMNYNYSYGYENSRDKIHYSDGRFAGYSLREDDLDETIPLPYDQVKFLAMGPYNYRLKANGATTLIDWNWNGLFGEKHIRADINYAYSTHAGTRDTVGKSSVAPWLFVHKGKAYVLSGETDQPRAAGADPTLGPSRSGKLILRRLQKPFTWDKPVNIADGLTGDPVAASVGSKIVVAFPTANGVAVRAIDPKTGAKEWETTLQTPGLIPTVGESYGKPVLMAWNPADGSISAWSLTASGLGRPIKLDVKSTNPPGLCTDTKTGTTILALAQNQDAARPNRWQIRRFDKAWKEVGMEWIEGTSGQSRGTGRLTVLFDRSRDAGPKGRVYLFGKGMTDEKTPWACTYVTMSIADKSVRDGWLVKRYYDEWTQSRSAPAAAWFDKDIIWAYRWVDGGGGATDDNLHVGYKGLGIQSEPFGDFDDIGYIRSFGAQHSLISLSRG